MGEKKLQRKKEDSLFGQWECFLAQQTEIFSLGSCALTRVCKRCVQLPLRNRKMPHCSLEARQFNNILSEQAMESGMAD